MIKSILIIALLGLAAFFLYERGDLVASKLHLWMKRDGKVVYFVPYGGAPATAEGFVQHDCHLFYKELESAFAKRGYELKYSRLKRIPLDADYLLVINQSRSERAARRVDAFPKGRKVAFIFEPPIIEPEAFTDEFADQFASIYTLTKSRGCKLHFPHDLKSVEWPDFAEKKLCTLVVGNKMSYFANSLYQERRNAIDYFESHHPESFTFYGRGWSGEDHPTYGGAPPSELKRETISHYRFSICYENSIDPGNVTEKIFDSFCAGCVPVYWGAPDIADWVPKECFIDRRDFADLDALYAHLSSMDRDEYEGYLARIRLFLSSDQASIRSIDQYAQTVVDAIDVLREK